MVLVLFETPAGYALFKVTDKGALADPQNIYKHFETSEKAQKIVRLAAFHKFEDTTAALSAATALCDSSLDDGLASFLSSRVAAEKDGKLKLGVFDPKLASIIREKVAGVKCLHDTAIAELIRGIRSQASVLLTGLTQDETAAMRLGLAHSLCRYKLKFSPDKVDVMIIQAISLLDELDKELNTYAMRVREWYGWHFPEMGKIVTDNMQYAKCVTAMSVRVNAATTDFSNILTEDVEQSLKDASQISMGTEIAEEDVVNIKSLCRQVVRISEYRASLYEYLKNRMTAIAPNLTTMVGELVGARLIAHAGSLLSLAKAPASTVQILGAEKALFRALKTKHDTPKYGLIYHASLVGQAAPKLKGKISRMLAAKTALACRADALGEADAPNISFDNRAKVENRLRQLEGGSGSGSGQTPKKGPTQEKYAAPKSAPKSYNTQGDNLITSSSSSSTKTASTPAPAKLTPSSSSSSSSTTATTATATATNNEEADAEAAKKARKAAKKAAKAAAAAAEASSSSSSSSAASSSKTKRKAETAVEAETVVETGSGEAPADEQKKKKKKKEKESQ